MSEDRPADYLAGLPAAQREELAQVNGTGLAALRGYLSSGQAVAFLGTGVSAPLYPLRDGLIGELVDAAADLLDEQEAATARVLARESPEEVVEIVRRSLGGAAYREVLREVLRVRTDPESGRSWTPVQELVCRCAFKAVVTTNYDPGIVDARMRVRVGASATGFTTWEDELGLDRWRTGDVFGEDELPVLFAHGQHNRPDSVVLTTTDYGRAYAGKLPQVLGRLVDGGHLVWIGFSFADQRIAAILREIAARSGTRFDPGAATRHVAVMPWDPEAEGNDPGILARRAQISYGAQVVLYPAPGGDHAALRPLLSALADPRFPAAAGLPAADAAPTPAGQQLPVSWVTGVEGAEHFTGRAEELARLDRWAADPQVSLVGVTAWGGAGKTALVTRWVQAGGASRRPTVAGVFGWSFYADPSAEHWAAALLEWVRRESGVQITGTGRRAATTLALLRAVPLLIVLDGLEVLQEGPAGAGFGRLLDGTLREVLSGACQQHHASLVVLTSRFPFADLETFDGDSARMLQVPPFTPAEGSALLAAAGGGWLPDGERRALVQAVDGHALAVGVLAGLLAARPPASDLAALQGELAAAARTSARVSRVLRFYADRLSEPDRYLLAVVSLFTRSASAAAVLEVARHEAFAGHLAGWTPASVVNAVESRLGGLASMHPDGTISAHPLVRDTFRALVLPAAQVAAQISLADLPGGQVTSRVDALRVVEVIELLGDAGQWEDADNLYSTRTGRGQVWKRLPAARLGQRAAGAFVATTARRDVCAARLGSGVLGFYLSTVGVCAMLAGDVTTAREYLSDAVRRDRDADDTFNLPIALQNLTDCLGHLGDTESARQAATEALDCAIGTRDQGEIRSAHAYLGWVNMLVGYTSAAEEQFAAADRIEIMADPEGQHLYSLRGVWWAEFLARTGRTGPARVLTERNRAVSDRNGWQADSAYCDRILGRLALTVGDANIAGQRLAAASECFRDGDYLTELAGTLADLAEQARLAGDLDAAERHAIEALTIATPRKLVPAQSAALAARARIRADQAAVAAVADQLAQGRDAADAALRLATHHHLAWYELDALRAHAALDHAEGTDHGWAAKADALHVRLVPPGLDPDPLATIKDQVARENLLLER
jgi:SIR2-like domain